MLYLGQKQARMKLFIKIAIWGANLVFLVHPNLDPTLTVAMGVTRQGGLSFYVGAKGR